MSKEFSKLKAKYIAAAVIKSAVAGVCVGIIVFSATFLALKLNAVVLAPVFYALIGIGCAAVAGVIAYFAFLRPTDDTVARSLDGDYMLGERVQTSLQFAGKKGTIVDLQRADTEEKLSQLVLARPSVKKLAQYIVLAVIAVALVIVSLAVPAKVPAEVIPPERMPYAFTELQRQSITQLIDDVNNSDLDESYKSAAVAPIEGLLDETDGLPAVHTVGEMQIKVTDAIYNVATALESDLSYVSLSTSVGARGLVYVVRALRRGADVYAENEPYTVEKLREFSRNKEEVATGVISHHFESYYSKLTADIDAAKAAERTDELPALYTALKTALTGAGTNLGDAVTAADVSDVLSTVLREMATKFGELGMSADEDVTTELSNTLDSFPVRIASALGPQTYRMAVNRYVDLKLWKTFDMDIEDIPQRFDDDYERDSDGNLDEPGGDSGSAGGDGGYGEGGHEFGSDDLVFDPDTGKYVPYGEIIDRYYGIAREYLDVGELTEEQKAAVRAYFQTLYSGFDEN